MPLYYYCCPAGHSFDRILKLANIEQEQRCPLCNEPGIRRIMAPAVRPDYAGYSCPATGKWIEGRKAHAENLKRTGCRLLEPGEKEAQDRRKVREEQQLDKAVDSTVEQFVTELPSQKREQLFNEVASGMTATVERL